MNAEEEKAVSPETAGATGEKGGTPSGKKRRRKWPIVVGVVAAILVVAGAGMLVWHEQPSFCNAICHSPMDSYVENYYDENSGMLSAAHAKNDVACLNCHVPTIEEQISELGKWVTGDFKDPLAMRKLGTREFCSAQGCHDDAAALAAATENYQGSGRNPHDSHYGDQLDCFSCHRVHQESVLYCSGCHSDMPIPDGWTGVNS